jgi:hypothetical protein
MKPRPLDPYLADDREPPPPVEIHIPIMGCPIHQVKWGVRDRQPQLPMSLGIPNCKLEGGNLRARSGVVMEEVVRAMLSLEQGPVNGSAKVCPDGYTYKGNPVEIKSLHRKNKMPIYDCRLAKELLGTIYIIGVHHRKKQINLEGIWIDLSKKLDCLIILWGWEVRQLAFSEQLQKIKSNKTKSGVRNGYQRKGYKDGYRNIPFKNLLEVASIELPFKANANLHGLSFSAPIFISRNLLLGEEPNFKPDLPE